MKIDRQQHMLAVWLGLNRAESILSSLFHHIDSAAVLSKDTELEKAVNLWAKAMHKAVGQALADVRAGLRTEVSEFEEES